MLPDRITYQLRCTVNHIGPEAKNGHYNAFIQSANSSFFCFDDTSVYPITTKHLLESDSPYILFYEMESSCWSSQISGMLPIRLRRVIGRE